MPRNTNKQRTIDELLRAMVRGERQRVTPNLSRDELRLEVAEAKGLPVELGNRLRGSTELELERDADRLLEALPNSTLSMDEAIRRARDEQLANDTRYRL